MIAQFWQTPESPLVIYQLASHHFPAPFRQSDLEKAFTGIEQSPEGAADFRVFRVTFGGPSNEILTMTAWQGDALSAPKIAGATTHSVETLEPTARPKAIGLLPEGGIYVLRWFTINSANFDEFVQLSEDAWVSMEEAFDALIIGLFRAETAPDGKTRMLLYTWYASLAAWEISRDQRPQAGASEAWKRFMRRHLLTDFTEASVISEVKFS